jgi:DNA-binding beta-propeller fold protein YncE
MFAMKLNSTHRLITSISCVLLAAGMLSVTPSAMAGKEKKKKDASQQPEKPLIDTSKLVWPEPPDIARIRYLTLLEGEEKPIEPSGKKAKKKQGWMDRLAGVEAQDFSKPALVHFLAKPYGVAVDSKGRVYAADSYVSAVFIFDLEAKKVDFIRNGVDARFRTIIGLAIDDNDRLFVTDAGLHQVSVFDANHKFETNFGSDDLGRPGGAAIDTENRFLYVVDTEKERIAVFDADSYKLLRTIGGPAKSENDDDPGTLAKPTNVAVDPDGNVYVSDTINNRIQIFDADGKFISMFGKAGDGVGYFARPKGVAVDADGHIWVADAAQNRIQIFDRDGHVLAYFGVPGANPGQFGLPAGLVIDKNNRVVVTEQLKGRVQIFRYVTDAEVAADKPERGKRVSAGAAQAAEVKK